MADVVTFAIDQDSDGTPTSGTPHNNSWKQAMAAAINDSFTRYQPVPFAAGNFTAHDVNGATAGLSWTPDSTDVLLNMLCRVNRHILKWDFYAQFTSVVGAPLSLRIALPVLPPAVPSGVVFDAGAVSLMQTRLFLCVDNSTVREGIVKPFDTTHIGLVRADGSQWNAATNTSSFGFRAEFLLNM